ncbi:MAG TPA: beta-ketoacyl-ACP synthase III [Acidimicrobiales bacterium]|nr:beta-ketoacyl-ACP synthase III [Acidimicrobiales bacterium]
MGSAITGWGEALPDRVVTNDEFAARLDTTDEWIVARTGIRERRMGGTTCELAIDAGRAALKSAGVDGSEVDLLVLATTTPDQTIPATSSAVHDALGCRGGAFDLNAACAGFVYALVVADSLLRVGHQRALVIGSETLSKVTDQDDRSTAVLFGDGAAAIVLESGTADELVLAYDLGVDGAATPLLYADHGGFIHMEGREVFRRAVRAELESIENVLARAGIGPDEIALFVPHQANVRIIEAVNQRVGLPMERTALVLERTGNTSAASIPLALADAADAGRIAEGDLVLLSGFGAGMTWASAVIRWGREGLRQ